MRSFITRRRALGWIGSATLLQSSARKLFPWATAAVGSRVPRFHVNTATGRINDPQRPLWINDCWNLWILWNRDFRMAEILEYNEEDLAATWEVFDWLRKK